MKRKLLKNISLSMLLISLVACGGSSSEESSTISTSEISTNEVSTSETSEVTNLDFEIKTNHGVREIYVGKTLKLEATYSDGSEAKLNYSSSDNAIAEVGEDGTITAKSEGVVTINGTNGLKTNSISLLVRSETPNNKPNSNWVDLGYLLSKDKEGFSNVQVYMLRTPTLLNYTFVNRSGAWLDETVEIFFDVGKNTATATKELGIDVVNENVYRLNVSGYGDEGWFTFKRCNGINGEFIDENFDVQALDFEKVNESVVTIKLDMAKLFNGMMQANDVFGMAMGHYSNVNNNYYIWSYGGYEISTARAAAFVRVDSLGKLYLAPSNFSNTSNDHLLDHSYCSINGIQAGLSWNLDAIYLNNSFILRWTNNENGWPESSGYGYRLTIQWFGGQNPDDWMNFGIMFPGACGDSWFMGDKIIYGRIGLNSYEWEIPYSIVAGFINVHPFIKITDPTNWDESGVIAEKVEDVYVTAKVVQKDIYFQTNATGDTSFFADGKNGTPMFLLEGDVIKSISEGVNKEDTVTDTGFYMVKASSNSKIRLSEITDEELKIVGTVNLIDSIDAVNPSEASLAAVNALISTGIDLQSLLNYDVNFNGNIVNAATKLNKILSL